MAQYLAAHDPQVGDGKARLGIGGAERRQRLEVVDQPGRDDDPVRTGTTRFALPLHDEEQQAARQQEQDERLVQYSFEEGHLRMLPEEAEPRGADGDSIRRRLAELVDAAANPPRAGWPTMRSTLDCARRCDVLQCPYRTYR